ncbi:MAG: hemolysin, partial [Myxococcaceae bacterium]
PPPGAPQHGVLVLHDVLDRWVSSRPIWNQHAYSVTNVNDDGTIPRTSAWKQNWKQPGLNNFRMNVQGSASPANSPDLTSGKNAPPGQPAPIPCVDGTLKLQAKVCNRGTGPVAQGVPVTFYKGAAAPAGKICTASTTGSLDPGECEVVGCDWAGADQGPTDVTVVADDDGTTHGVASECLEQNNRTVIKGLTCTTIG